MSKTKFPFVTLGLALLSSSCLIEDRGNENLAGKVIQPSGVTSYYHLAFYTFDAGVPSKVSTVLKRIETQSSSPQDLGRELDYSFSMTEGQPEPGELPPFLIRVSKQGTLGLTQGHPLSTDSTFETSFYTREKPVAGKLYTCSSDVNDPVCVFRLIIPVTTALSADEFGVNAIKKVFDVAPEELKCDFQLTSISEEFNMKEVIDPTSRHRYRRTEKIPSSAVGPEKAKKLSFGYRCWHTPSRTVAVYGHFLQNTKDWPALTEDGQEIRIR